MNSQLYVYCKCLAIIAVIATTLAGAMALDQSTHPGPAGLCIASALVLAASLIAMAILHSFNRQDPPKTP